MKRTWTPEELVAHWTLLPAELDLLGNKTGPTRLGFALLLKFFHLEARFPESKHELPRVVVAFVAQQVHVAAEEALVAWLIAEVLAQEQDPAHLRELVYARLRALRLEPPTPRRLRRLLG